MNKLALINGDVEELRRQLLLINDVVTTDTYNLGDHFFETIVTKINEALSADITFVGVLQDSDIVVETIAAVNTNGLIKNFSYQLEGSPCEYVVGQKPCTFPKEVQSLFPNDEALVEMGVEAYVGVPLFDSQSKAIGIIVSLFKEPMGNEFAAESILMFFASRAGAELEHQKMYAELEKQQQTLELKVEERTKALGATNANLKSINKQLVAKSKIIDEQNQEQQATLERLKHTQLNLAQSEKMASLGILTAGVAHEINNPLNYILGSYSGLKSIVEESDLSDNENVKMLLDSIKTGVDHASGIVSSLNQFSRSQDDFNEQCDVHEILDNCLLMLKSKMKNIQITKSFTTKSSMIIGNVGKLHQVFINIMANACDAMLKNGELLIVTESDTTDFNITISDNGLGVNNEDLVHIMDPFFTTKEPGKGTGLGLSISYSIIEEHNGTLSINSIVDKGTVVKLTIPKKPAK